MRQRKRKLLAALSVLALGYVSTTAAAATATAQPTDAQLMSEMTAMQQKMQQMQIEMNQMKAKLAATQSAPTQSPQNATTVASAASQKPSTAPPTAASSPNDHGELTNRGFNPFGNWVVEGPFTGLPIHYNGYDLVVNTPSVNEGHYLLLERSKEDAYSMKETGKPQQTPRLVLSGSVVGIVQGYRPFSGKPQSDINLTTVELDNMMEISSWVTGFAAFAYNDGTAGSSPQRVANSEVQVSKAFILLGNLSKAPLYGELGQLYVPFGRYASYMISNPMTQYVGENQQRAVTFGYHPDADRTVYASTYAFQGTVDNANKDINNFGLDVGYDYHIGPASGDFGASYINDIADANGMQSTGSTAAFTGFAASSQTELLKHGVPGGDIHLNAGVGPISFIGEYVQALQSFYKGDMSFDNRGAEPKALHLEAAYGFHLFNFPTLIAVGYGHSYEALALNLPRARYIMTLTQTLSKYTLLSLELRHDLNYGKHNSATGNGLVADVPNQLGRADNMITAQLGIYF